MAEQQRTLVDSVKELREVVNSDMVVQANHLCIGSMRDVAILVGAYGASIYLGKMASVLLVGRWRALPFVVGAGCLLAARFVPSEKMRFATRASAVVGGSALMLSMVHFTLQATLEESRTMEA